MTLKEQLNDAMKAAMKARDTLRKKGLAAAAKKAGRAASEGMIGSYIQFVAVHFLLGPRWWWLAMAMARCVLPVPVPPQT